MFTCWVNVFQEIIEGLAWSLQQHEQITNTNNPSLARDCSKFRSGDVELLDTLKEIREKPDDGWRESNALRKTGHFSSLSHWQSQVTRFLQTPGEVSDFLLFFMGLTVAEAWICLNLQLQRNLAVCGWMFSDSLMPLRFQKKKLHFGHANLVCCKKLQVQVSSGPSSSLHKDLCEFLFSVVTCKLLLWLFSLSLQEPGVFCS